MNLIDKILKEGLENKYDNLTLLTEVKLNRILDYHFKNGFIIISACRGDNTSVINKALSKKLLADIISSKHSYIPVYGGFIENKGTDEEREVQEVSFLVPKNKDENINNLVELGKNLCAKYNQDSFLLKNPGDDYKCQFITRDGEVDGEFTGLKLNDISQTYFTKLNKGGKDKVDRRFTNEVFVKSGANTINEHHSRASKGEIQIIEYGNK